MSDSNETDLRCRECQARLVGNESVCWLCGSTLPTDIQERVPPQSVGSPFAEGYLPRHARGRAAMQFSLASLMMFMTLASVLMGLTALYPGPGIALSICALPALIRTWLLSLKAEGLGKPMSMWEQIRLFLLNWLGAVFLVPLVIMVIAAALLVALFVICLVVGDGRPASSNGAGPAPALVILGLALAAFAAYNLYQAFFGKRKRK